VKASGQLHAPASLSPRNESPDITLGARANMDAVEKKENHKGHILYLAFDFVAVTNKSFELG
jgi:hypothetical protein